MLRTAGPLHGKTIDDDKEKPQTIKFYNFTKDGTDIVDYAIKYFTHQIKVMMLGYSRPIVHVGYS